MYIVDYGMTEGERLRAPRWYSSKRAAMNSAAEMVRAYGKQGWAYVARSVNLPDGSPEPPLATWRNGKRAS